MGGRISKEKSVLFSLFPLSIWSFIFIAVKMKNPGILIPGFYILDQFADGDFNKSLTHKPVGFLDEFILNQKI